MVAAFALDRLDEDRGDLVRRRYPVEQRLLDLANEGTAVLACWERGRPGRSPKSGRDGRAPRRAHPREIDVVDVGHERREAAAVNELRPRERHRPVGAAVERPEERD